MRPNPIGRDEEMAVLSVLAAAAREAEELLSSDPDLEADAIAECDRRLQRFMERARQLAR